MDNDKDAHIARLEGALRVYIEKLECALMRAEAAEEQVMELVKGDGNNAD